MLVPDARAEFAHFLALPTRWMDNDAYGHVNNVVYYSFFDTAVKRFLIDCDVLRIDRSPVIGLVVETGCHYHRPLAFPETVEVGLRVAHLGTSSVRYELGVLREGDDTAAAEGHFVHVYVDRDARTPTPLPAKLRAALQAIHRPPADAG